MYIILTTHSHAYICQWCENKHTKKHSKISLFLFCLVWSSTRMCFVDVCGRWLANDIIPLIGNVFKILLFNFYYQIHKIICMCGDGETNIKLCKQKLVYTFEMYDVTLLFFCILLLKLNCYYSLLFEWFYFITQFFFPFKWLKKKCKSWRLQYIWWQIHNSAHFIAFCTLFLYKIY